MSKVDRLYFAGLVSGPVGWGVTLQTVYALVSAECALAFTNTIPATALGATIALFGGGISWLTLGHIKEEGSRHFIALISVGTAVLFALAILLQMAAAFVFKGCEI
jgi:hypothetical protein